MKRKPILVFVFSSLAVICLCLLLQAKDKTVQSSWAASPVVIDASVEEWSDEVFISRNNPDVDVAIRNDAQNLYLLFIIRNNEFLSTLEATGLTIYLDPQTKKKRDYGFRFFRRRVSAEEFIRVLEKLGQVLSDDQKAEIKTRPSYLLYDCEINEKKKVLPLESIANQGVELPTFHYVKQTERTVFELRIPLVRGGEPSGVRTAPGSTLSLGFEWGGLTREMQAARLARAAAASERGVERETASESHARGSRMEDVSTSTASPGLGRSAPRKYSFWLSVRLASPPEAKRTL